MTGSRSTPAQVAALETQIIAVVTANAPLSLRHVYYLLLGQQPLLISKGELSYRKVGRHLRDLRRTGAVPYDAIIDPGRTIAFPNVWANVGEQLTAALSQYRRDFWAGHDEAVWIMSEKNAIVGTFAEVTERLAVTSVATGGYSSVTLNHEAARAIRFENDNGKYVTVYLLGDHDPSGVGLRDSFQIEAMTLDPNLSVSFVQLGVSCAQIAQHTLIDIPVNMADPRAT